jgi:hypothetical protein
MSAVRVAAFMLLLPACSASRPTPVDVPLAVASTADAAVPVANDQPDAAVRPDAAEVRVCTILALTRHLPSLKARTFMLQPDETTRIIDLSSLAAAVVTDKPWTPSKRLPRAEQAFARAVDRWLGDGTFQSTLTFVAPAGPEGGHFSFEAHGHAVGYGLCHGVYDDFVWRGTFDVDGAGGITGLTLTGTTSIAEDMCGTGDSNKRVSVGRYKGTYAGELSRACEP